MSRWREGGAWDERLKAGVREREREKMERMRSERYRRQLILFGEEGQKRLRSAKIFVAGAGGLGSASLLYLTAAGIGRIRIADCDTVEESNLNRQILHFHEDIGKQKVISAKEKLERLNPEVDIEILAESITEDNVDAIVGDSELIVDAMDNFQARYALNKCAIRKKIPLFHGAVYGFEGQITTIIPERTACLRCIFPKAPSGAGETPIVGATCGVVASIQVSEVLKYLLRRGSLLENRMLWWDGLNARIEEISLRRNPKCEDCGDGGAEGV